MDESSLIHLYRELTAADETLARSVAMFVECGLPSSPGDSETTETLRPPEGTGSDSVSSADGEARPPD
jgi:hypothetical protein